MLHSSIIKWSPNSGYLVSTTFTEITVYDHLKSLLKSLVSGGRSKVRGSTTLKEIKVKDKVKDEACSC